MEEILASIRRIIAEDGEAASSGPAGPQAQPRSAPPRTDEVLELTEVVDKNGLVVSVPPGSGKGGAAKPTELRPSPREAMPSITGEARPAAAPRVVAERPVAVPPTTTPSAAPPIREPQAPTPARPEPSLAAPRNSSDRLVSPAAALASVAALSQLANTAPQREQAADTAMGVGGRTLDDLVRELLHPMLKQWLDANLPKLVERLVHEEITRMVREAQGR